MELNLRSLAGAFRSAILSTLGEGEPLSTGQTGPPVRAVKGTSSTAPGAS